MQWHMARLDDVSQTGTVPPTVARTQQRRRAAWVSRRKGAWLAPVTALRQSGTRLHQLAALIVALGCSSSSEPSPADTAPPVETGGGAAAAPATDPDDMPAASGEASAPSRPEPGAAADLPLTGGTEPSGTEPGGAEPLAPVQQALEPLPTVRQEHAVAVLGAEVFVIGGFTPGATASVAAYDPSSDSWRSVADFPSVLHHANAGVVDGRLLVAGFYVGASFTNASGAVYEYDATLDAWLARTPLPAGTERASGCVAVFDGKLYVFGGARNGSVTDASAYEPASDTWEELPNLPEAREHCAAGAIDGRIIIAGGRAEGIGGFQPNTWAYDPDARRYEPRAPLLTARGGVAGAVLAGKLYLFGGEGNASDPSGVFPQVEAYDPETDTWQALPSMLAPRHGLAAAATDDRIYLPGGASRQGFGAEATNTVFFLE